LARDAPIDMTQAVPPGATGRKGALPFYLQLWFLVLVAMVLGAALGHVYPDAGVRMGRWARLSSRRSAS
jgi:hypothetical protein